MYFPGIAMGDKNYPIKDERKWLQISMEPPHPSVNPMLPEMLVTALTAQRSDGLWVRVEGSVPVTRIRILPNAQAGMVQGLRMIEGLLKQMETYRNCECVEGKPCEKHGGGPPN
jgi:hypothetical protein